MKTALLMGVVTGLLVLIGYIIGVIFGIELTFLLAGAFLAAVIMNVMCYFYSDMIVRKMYDVSIVSEKIAPELYAAISRLSMKAGLPMPKIAFINSEVPNAFATGRNPENAVVAVTSGALSLLKGDEMEAVLAHELGHIKNRDMLISTVAAAVAGIISYVGFAGRWMLSTGDSRRESLIRQVIGDVILTIFVPFAVLLVRMAISRSREFAADESGAFISGKPEALADALLRIEDSVTHSPMKRGNPATAHLFIVNPFPTSRFSTLMSTHPPTQSRVERLRKMAQSPHQ